MSNRMNFELEFYLKEDINNENIKILNMLFNNCKNNAVLSNIKFFKMPEWEELFSKYNGYPDFLKVFALSDECNQYYIKVNVEYREDRSDLLDAFFEWIIPYIDVSKSNNKEIGIFECDSSFSRRKIKIEGSEVVYPDRDSCY